ncbi:MAG: hypothetical protein BWY64_01587 [bacterium ADurb.Bin363]|nr:MAG: hypothetical protein BWY64_01587 [bacterium ADurb.Bin363]
MDLLNSIRVLAKNILNGAIYDTEEMEANLDEVLVSIDELRNKYGQLDFPEAESIVLLLFESLDLYEEVIETIISYRKGQEERMAEAMMKAEEASDILCHIEDLIGESKEMFDDIGFG